LSVRYRFNDDIGRARIWPFGALSNIQRRPANHHRTA
jgi:hypothetical protein